MEKMSNSGFILEKSCFGKIFKMNFYLTFIVYFVNFNYFFSFYAFYYYYYFIHTH